MGCIAVGYLKPLNSLVTVETFLKLLSFLTDKLFCIELWVGRGQGVLVGMPGELSAKHHVAVFTR